MKNAKKFIKNFVGGILDTILPNLDNSIKIVESKFLSENDKTQVNWFRLFTSLATFIFLVLNLFKIITIDDLIRLIEAYNNIK